MSVLKSFFLFILISSLPQGNQQHTHKQISLPSQSYVPSEISRNTPLPLKLHQTFRIFTPSPRFIILCSEEPKRKNLFVCTVKYNEVLQHERTK